MKSRKEEASPVARLQNDVGKTIGWVYVWNNSELSILWIGRHRDAKRIDPPLRQDTLARAKAVTTDQVIDLLESLSATNDDGPS